MNKSEIICVIGGNGAGKSTLALLLAGAKRCRRGKIVCSKEIRRSLVVQNPQALFTEISVEDELYIMSGAIKIDKVLSNADKRNMCESMLDKMELKEYRHSNPLDISGGQMQKLAIAKALMLEPDVLILDEPTKGIDAYSKKKLGNILREYAKSGRCVCIVTHDLEFTARYANRCVFMSEGEIISDGDVHSVLGENMFYTTSVARITKGEILSI